MQPWFAVLGATGTGKTKLALQLAAAVTAAEIINTDAMQVGKRLAYGNFLRISCLPLIAL